MQTSRSFKHTASRRVRIAHTCPLPTCSLCTLAVLCAALAVLFQDVLDRNFSYTCAILCFALLLSCAAYVFHSARTCWISNSQRSLHRNSMKCFEQCLKLLNQQGVLLKKSIRYIQEVEVISRGFTMVSPYTPVVRLERAVTTRPNRQCVALREVCFSVARAQFSTLRDATLEVMEELPLVAEIDHVSNYLAMVRLEETTPWINVMTDDTENGYNSLEELTGFFSLAALKTMNSLFLEQRSEFIRRLVLCTCSDARLEPKTTANFLNSWSGIVRKVSASCETALGKLQRSYDCHRQRPDRNRYQTPGERPSQGDDEMQRVGCAVRSLRLHLEATLNRVITVEEALEGVDRQLAGGEDDVGALMCEMLDSVRRELTASQDCLQEAASSLEKMSHKDLSSKQHKQDGQGGIVQSSVSAEGREPILLFPMRDSEIEFDDQIFEAYTDTDPGQRDDEGWGEEISDAEKMRRRREAEETKRMLQELRSVLTVRKAQRERMKSERIKTYKKTSGRVSPSDSSKTDGGTEQDQCTGRGMPEGDIGTVDTPSENAGGILASNKALNASEDSSDFRMLRCINAENPGPRENAGGRTSGSSRDFGPNSPLHDDADARKSSIGATDDVGSVGLSSTDAGEMEVARFVTAGPPCSTSESELVHNGEFNESYWQEGTSVGDSHMTKLAGKSSVMAYDMDQSETNLPGNEPLQDSATVKSPFNLTEGQTQFGMSFLPSLAAEAAKRSRQCRQEEETFIGSDDDSEASEVGVQE
ncbi:vezatin-like isoform X2 [Acanthaster planci]|uniref:Vezatin n=1 Tax=Acanthaster planci TaxID=133434 RepID=A0A8B7ZVD7_ACAPL|nr:vezatin-like isoform X2 [Acanthaster planci]